VPPVKKRTTEISHVGSHDDVLELRRVLGSPPSGRYEHRGLWQYDIDRGYRIIYRIDDEARQILIEYIGPHPDWGKKSRGASRIKR